MRLGDVGGTVVRGLARQWKRWNDCPWLPFSPALLFLPGPMGALAPCCLGLAAFVNAPRPCHFVAVLPSILRGGRALFSAWGLPPASPLLRYMVLRGTLDVWD